LSIQDLPLLLEHADQPSVALSLLEKVNIFIFCIIFKKFITHPAAVADCITLQAYHNYMFLF